MFGNTASDVITLTTQISKGSIDLSGGADSLTLGSAANTVSVANVETLIGGTDCRHDHAHRSGLEDLHRSRIGRRQADARQIRQ